MHLDLVEQRPSRKGKEREPISRDNMAMREPQPTDLDEKLMALRRRTAACVVDLISPPFAFSSDFGFSVQLVRGTNQSENEYSNNHRNQLLQRYG